MVWFKVDDGFYSHAKVAAIPRAIRGEAVGTWTLCGTWSASKELDGFVPMHVVEEIGGTLAGAQALVDAGLWKTRRAKGFQFVNWASFQPTRHANDERRKADAERQRLARERKASKDGGSSQRDADGIQPRPSPPSRPVPDPSTTKTDSASSSSKSGATTVDNPVDNYEGALADTAARLDVGLLEAGVVVDVILGRKGTPPQSIRRYVKGAITRQIHEWENWKHTGDLPE